MQVVYELNRVQEKLVVLTLLLSSLLGCGGSSGENTKRAAVKGTVNVDGKPLETGVIMFLPAKGTIGPSSGAAISKGQYSISVEQGVSVGLNKVQVQGSMKTGKKIKAGSPSPPGTMVDELAEIVNISEDHEVKPGQNTFDFDLKSNVFPE